MEYIVIGDASYRGGSNSRILFFILARLWDIHYFLWRLVLLIGFFVGRFVCGYVAYPA
jgi:hypothetical protein